MPAGAGHAIRADQLAARLPGKARQRLSAGEGAKGHRWQDWARITIGDPGPESVGATTISYPNNEWPVSDGKDNPSATRGVGKNAVTRSHLDR